LADTIFVNLHTHTAFSDGAPTPEALAQSLAEAGVRYAALTDHDTVDGLTRFAQALEPHGIPSLSGIELTTNLDGRLAHLVAYGFDPDHPELRSTLASMHPARDADVHTIAGSLRRAGGRRAAGTASSAVVSTAPDGTLDIGDAIALIHRAGGRAFLAHPLHLQSDLGRLEAEIVRLKAMGLDGIEAIYAEFSADEQAGLRQLARNHELLVSAGTDYHGIDGFGSLELGIDMPADDWARFRDAIFSGPGFSDASPHTDGVASASTTDPADDRRRSGTRSFALRVALPAVAALALFLIALWGLILPSFEQTLVERKREMIRELTNSAWSVLAAYQHDEETGLLTRGEAQVAAAGVIEELRYGPDGLDYFWIQDTQPTMVMHPYRTDLDGQDLSGFTDSRGARIFVEFSDLVQADGQGYVDYVWQWFDDPERLEPKESYVKGFEPWGWVIGTGVYTDDVRAEIDRIARNLVLTAMGISGAIALLLLFVLQQSLRIERRREEVVTRLRESTQRYHALVEATTEGTLLIVDGRCHYANPMLLGLLGYTSRQLEFVQVDDVLPHGEANEALWQVLTSGTTDAPQLGLAHEGSLTHSDGRVVECVLTLDPVVFGDQAGYILLARDMAGLSVAARSDTLAHGAPAGVFRALASRRAVFMEISPAGREMLSQFCDATEAQPALADCFADPAEYGRFFRRVLDEGEVRDYILPADNWSM